jgi:hypothetical protein
MQILLEARDLDVESENFRGERVLAGKFLCALDTTLPGGDRHRPINSVGPQGLTEIPSAVASAIPRWLSMECGLYHLNFPDGLLPRPQSPHNHNARHENREGAHQRHRSVLPETLCQSRRGPNAADFRARAAESGRLASSAIVSGCRKVDDLPGVHRDRSGGPKASGAEGSRTLPSIRSTRSSDPEPFGACRMRSPRRSRNSIPFHSLVQPSWPNFWNRGSHNRSSF